MTRADVRKVAWTLRLLGYGMLAGAFSLMILASQHTSAAPRSAPAHLAR